MCALLALPLIGAAIGAASKPGSSLRYRAEATLAVDLGSEGIRGDVVRRNARLQLLSDAARSPAALAAVSDALGGTLGVEDLRRRTDVARHPGAGTVIVTARGPDDEAAASLANAVALEALAFVRTAIPDPRRGGFPVGDFEAGVEGWTIDSRFSVRPTFLGLDTRAARYNNSSLRARCGPDQGCGPATVVGFPFRVGQEYVASGWVRANRPMPVKLVFGATPEDVISSPERRAVRRWRRLVVVWRPQRNYATGEIGIQTQAPGNVALNVDGVLLIDPATSPVARLDAALPFAEEAVALRTGSYAGLVPARAGGEETNRTARAAGLGAGAGLLVAGVALGCGLLARRRRDKQGQHQANQDPGADL